MLCATISMGKVKYNRSCYMVRAKAFKAYKEGRWNIHDLFENDIADNQLTTYVPLFFQKTAR